MQDSVVTKINVNRKYDRTIQHNLLVMQVINLNFKGRKLV